MSGCGPFNAAQRLLMEGCCDWVQLIPPALDDSVKGSERMHDPCLSSAWLRA